MSDMTSHDDDFYEEDEPVQKIIDAFERGTKQLTRPVVLPRRGFSERILLPGGVIVLGTERRWTANEAVGVPVPH